jgi:hypothetical protein
MLMFPDRDRGYIDSVYIARFSRSCLQNDILPIDDFSFYMRVSYCHVG